MLEIRSARKVFYAGQPDEKVALDNLDLTLQTGEFGVVIGSNGAGKSTMLNAVSGALPLDNGQIAINGDDVTDTPVHKRAKRIARVFQDPMLLDEHTAALDPRTADLVMQATVRAVDTFKLTTLMVTHNMAHAVDYGHRVIMLDAGRVKLEIGGDEKANVTVAKLVDHFAVKTDAMMLGAGA